MEKFEALLNNFSHTKKIRIGVVHANDEASIHAVFHEKVRAFLEPVLIGNKTIIQNILAEISATAEIIETEDEAESAAVGVSLVKEQKVDFLMKGHLQTRTFLKAVVNRETGIAKSSLLSHVAINDIPTYHKLLLTTDGGMVLAPSLAEKKILIKHGVEVMQKLGIKKPKVGLLAAAEVVNPKVPASVEAQALAEEFKENADFYIDGPISLDLSISPEIVAIKHYQSTVAGDADILVGPDITTMNVLGKSITVLAKGSMAGIIMGAQVPIVMVSRGSSELEKAYSILIAMYCSKE